MIFRAIFWIGLVALLMPHEPDLGFGRPAQAGSNVAGDVASWAKDKLQPNLKDPESLCRYNTDACAAGASMIDNFRSATLRSLAEVRADIKQNRRKTVLTH
jgi:hypothetical protein